MVGLQRSLRNFRQILGTSQGLSWSLQGYHKVLRFIVKSPGHPWNSQDFCEISRTSVNFRKVSQELFGVPRTFLGFLELPWVFVNFLEVPWNSFKSPELFWSLLDFLGIIWIYLESPEFLWSPQGFLGVPRTFSESSRLLWSSRDFPGVPKTSLESSELSGIFRIFFRNPQNFPKVLRTFLESTGPSTGLSWSPQNFPGVPRSFLESPVLSCSPLNFLGTWYLSFSKPPDFL